MDIYQALPMDLQQVIREFIIDEHIVKLYLHKLKLNRRCIINSGRDEDGYFLDDIYFYGSKYTVYTNYTWYNYKTTIYDVKKKHRKSNVHAMNQYYDRCRTIKNLVSKLSVAAPGLTTHCCGKIHYSNDDIVFCPNGHPFCRHKVKNRFTHQLATYEGYVGNCYGACKTCMAQHDVYNYKSVVEFKEQHYFYIAKDGTSKWCPW